MKKAVQKGNVICVGAYLISMLAMVLPMVIL